VAAPPAAAPEVIAGAVAAPDTASSGAAVPDTAATDVTTTAAPEVPVLVGAATEPHLASAADAANLAPGEAAEVPLPPLVVGIRHASLEHSPYPLLIGHFAGAPITGAEARLDERLDGRLSRLQLLGQTPRQIGESILLPPVDDATPPGVVVVGLGPAGELTSTELTAIVTRALLKMLSIQLEQQLEHERLEPSPEGVPPKRRGLGISAVLIGTSSGGGLTVEGSIRGILAGVTTANERLRRVRVDLRGSVRRATDYVHFARLEMVERYADRVDLVAAALTRLQELEAQRVQDRDEEAAATGATGPAPGSGTTTAPASGPREPSVLFVPEPIRGEGASSSNPPLDRAEDVWRRVGIAVESPPGVSAGGPTIAGIDQTAAPPPANPGVDITIGPAPSQLVLRFTSMGRLARAERLISIVEPSIVQPLIDDAISRDADPDVSGTLFELLVPDLLKGELNDGENLHLLLDDTTAPYPWELLAGRADDVNPQVPLALRVGVLRQFLESEDLRHDIRRAAGDSILVVGNPPPGPGFHPLPAAAAEAQGVATLFGGLGGKWNVEAMVWDASGQQVLPADPLSHEPGEHVLHRLMNGDWRIVHIAAHGDITNDPSTTGVILGGQLHLTANVFKRLSVVPDLVFLNACHLGTIAPRDLRGMNRLAASVAESLLRIGTRAVIVAGWAVNDVAADAFARTVYGQLLDGLHLGDAVHGARLAARDAAPHAQTWGAYQCYGDPGFRLVARTPSTKGQPPVTVGELRRRVQRLAASASDQGRGFSPDTDDAKVEHDDELAELADRARELGSSGALAELADVHAELGHLRTAAGLYQEALGQGGRDVPVEAIEQLGNVLVRDAQARVRDDHTPLDDVRPQLDEASEWLGRALVLGETGERLALLASYHKRCAAMAAGEERRSHLDAALEHYAKAEARTDSAYYWNNWLQLYELVALEVGARPDEWRPPEARPLARPSAPASDGLNGTGAGTPLDELPPPPQGATFWDRAGIGDGMVTDAIRSGRLSAAELIDVYQHAFRLRSSARERASVTDHLRDLVDLLPAEHPLRAALMEAASTLSAWTS
jgi:tetratricopeptide (TPR) repeat protein